MKTITKTKEIYIVIEFTKQNKTMPSVPKKIIGAFPTLKKAEQCASADSKAWRNVVKIPYFE